MNYQDGLASFLKHLEHSGFTVNEYSEFKFESLADFSLHGNKKELVDWYYALVNSSTMRLEQIPLSDCKQWSIDEETGSICHSSGEFFRRDPRSVRLHGNVSCCPCCRSMGR